MSDHEGDNGKDKTYRRSQRKNKGKINRYSPSDYDQKKKVAKQLKKAIETNLSSEITTIEHEIKRYTEANDYFIKIHQELMDKERAIMDKIKEEEPNPEKGLSPEFKRAYDHYQKLDGIIAEKRARKVADQKKLAENIQLAKEAAEEKMITLVQELGVDQNDLDDEEDEDDDSEKSAKTNSEEHESSKTDETNKLVQILSSAMKDLAKQQKDTRFTIDQELPIFSGRCEDWTAWFHHYNHTTSKYKFSNTENFYRLKKSLQGAAEHAVRHLYSSQDNVPKIISSLKREFGNKTQIINALLKTAKSAANPELTKPQSFIEYARAVEGLVCSIRSHQQDDYLKSPEILSSLVKKLPSLYQEEWIQWRMAVPSRQNNLDYFEQWVDMKKEVACEKSSLSSETQNAKPTSRFARGNVFLANDDVVEQNEDVHLCVLCGTEGHALPTCRRFADKSYREKWAVAKNNQVCFCCLKSNHRMNSCENLSQRKRESRFGFHRLLTNSNTGQNQDMQHSRNWRAVADEASANHITLNPVSDTTAITKTVVAATKANGPLKIVPVTIWGPGGQYQTLALLDSGASVTLVNQRCAEKLGLQGKKNPIRIEGYGGIEKLESNSKQVRFEISGTFPEALKYTVEGARTVEDLYLSSFSFDPTVTSEWKHLEGIPVQGIQNTKPELIVGCDNYHLMKAEEIVEAAPGEPIGERTKLGWVIIDPTRISKEVGVFHVTEMSSEGQILHDMIKNYYFVENDGVLLKSVENTRDTTEAMKILQSTTSKTTNKFQTGLLWRTGHEPLPDNWQDALRRLISTERKLERNKEMKKKYFEVWEEYLKKGYLRKLTGKELEETTQERWFTPHFPVFNPNKPNKIRIVFDAAAKTRGVCLNDKLFKGPDLLESLITVLMNFRIHPVAITGDIAEMFHRVEMIPKDRKFQLVLWRNGETSRDPDVYEMTVLIFGATCSPASAIYVKNVNAEEHKENFPDASRAIVKDFYVDDCLSGALDDITAIKLQQDITSICAKANFEIKNWMSNSKVVLDAIPVDQRAEAGKCLFKSQPTAERILGLQWDSVGDTFGYKAEFSRVKPEILEGRRPTKREMASLIMSLYDPLGFIAQFRVKGMILLQAVWRSGISWDDTINDEIFTFWKIWVKELQQIETVEVRRCYSYDMQSAENITQHTFVDASEEAICAVSYLQIEVLGAVQLSFLIAKVKVASLKKMTIPRLELLAAVLGSKLADSVKSQLRLNISQRYFWCDSRTVLSWLSKESWKFKEFVANRVGYIQETTNSYEWRWCPTAENIADVGTRLKKETDFHPESPWYSGPSFLKKSISEWPTIPEKEHTDEENIGQSEERGTFLIGHIATISSFGPDPTHFSSFSRLIRATAAVKVAFLHWKKKALHAKYEELQPYHMKIVDDKRVFTSNLPVEATEEAEVKIIKQAQSDYFTREIQLLKNNENVDRKSSIHKLSPWIDGDGLLRVRGRIQAAIGIPANTKQPIILPPKSYETMLIIQQEHRNLHHQGHRTVLANLRERFWVINGMTTIKSAINKCQYCKVAKAQPRFPEMGALPACRLAQQQPPFTFTGLDYFGPLDVTVGRRREKRYGALFTCMTTRAIHIEIAQDMTTDSLLMVMSRFIDTRGRPKHLYSDNGTNIVGAANELKRALREVDFLRLMEECTAIPMKWHFIPPHAPHMGGAWERIIQTVKRALKNILKESCPREETLRTAFKSAENMVNSRPLTMISNDPSDPEWITPNHIIRGPLYTGPTYLVTLEDSDAYNRKQWRYSQLLADRFWEVWTRDYLPNLLTRSKWHDNAESVDVGDIVFIVDENAPRNLWKRGVISKIFPGKDGLIRSVQVTTRQFKSKKENTYYRPVHKICPIVQQRPTLN